MRLDFNQKYYRLRRFLKSTDFSKALLLGSAITFPIIIGSYLDSFNFGLALALGALLCSSSDVNGSPRHKNIGIILSAIIVVIVSLIGGYLNFNTWLFIPVLGILTFAISYLAVFGFRASLIAFSGLFAIVLSFADPGDDIEIYQRAILMGAGGLVYLVISMLHQYFSPRKQTDQYLALTLELTGKYLETRGKLIDGNSDRPLLQGKLIELQTELNEKHEVLRDILISARKNSGNSTYQRKRLLLFIQLVDILELAMAHPVNYEKMDRLMEMDRRPLESFQKLIFKMGTTLEQLSSDLIYNKISPITTDLKDQLKLIYTDIDKFKAHSQSYLDEGLIMLQNLYDYQEKQAQNILKIQQLLIDSEKGEIGKIRNEEITQFITPQEFDPKTLLENFSLDSVIFRHSLRLTVVLVIGYIIGEYFELQNAYWILLTIIVIMRPSYGLTKTRSKQRTAGTVIGAAIAIGIVFLTQNPVIYAVLSVTTLITAFAMVQKNYKTSAIFVTLSVVFIYALLEPNVLEVIQYRVIDTLIGAALATIGNIFIWPSWGFIGIKAVIAESIEANKNYLKEVNNFYINKGKVPTS
ncbi:FUSC family protein [soil metagenome]